MVLVHCFLLGGVAFGGGGLCAATEEVDRCGGTFVFSFLFYFFFGYVRPGCRCDIL
jgi:hypothetical protein